MKAATAVDWRRRIITKDTRWTTRVNSIVIEAVPGLGTLEFPIPYPVTIFSGPNGAGKSTVLKALWAALDPEAAYVTVSTDRKLSSGTIACLVQSDGEERRAEVRFRDDELEAITKLDLDITYIDSAAESLRYKAGFNEFVSADELTNGFAGKELGKVELGEINFILKREYRSVKLYEVELAGEVPFFEVSYGDDRYDSRTMGAGEIAALHLWWSLNRLPEGSIALIEEPEAFLSFGCQAAIAKYMAGVFVKRRVSSIVSTHAAPIIAFFPPQCVTFLSRDRQGLQASNENPHPALLKSLGIDPPIEAVLFVEDQAAKLFCRSLLQRLNPSVSRRIEIEVRNGEANVTAALRLASNFSTPLVFRGVYDGDMRGRVPEELTGVSAFLPGDEAIELTFKALVIENVEQVKTALGSEELRTVLNSLEGVDIHDWYAGVAAETGLTREQLFPILFNIWFNREENEAAATQSYNAIAAFIER